jgi:hypothetical protein
MLMEMRRISKLSRFCSVLALMPVAAKITFAPEIRGGHVPPFHTWREIRAVKTIDFAQAPPDVACLLDQARNDDVIVRLADGSEFLLVAIDDFDQEIARTRNNPRLMALLEARAKQTATVPLDEVKRRLGF